MRDNINKDLKRQAEEIREMEREIFKEINKERIKKGKEPLEMEGYFIDELMRSILIK